jgi:hypothetical protein
MTQLLALGAPYPVTKMGKGEVAGFLLEWAEERGLLAVSRGFADRVKLAVARQYKPDIELQEAVEWIDKIKDLGFVTVNSFVVDDGGQPRSIKITDMLIREQIERMGEEVGRQMFGEDFWVNQLIPDDDNWSFRFAIPSYERPDLCIVHDMRYDNEMVRVREVGGKAWLITNGQPAPEPPEGAHPSRLGIHANRYDVVITNNGSLEELRQIVFDTADKVLI